MLQSPLLAARRAPTTTRTRRRAKISCIGWDPEGVLGPPQGGHIARLEFRRRLERDSEAREAFERQVREEHERRRKEREARVIPDTDAGLVEFFLDTEAREIEVEIGRLRPRLNQGFFDHIMREIAQIKFAVTRTAEMEDRLIELEAMHKVLLEGVEAYDELQNDLVTAKERLMKILQSRDRKSTLLQMVERNELNMSILTLLDENIASAKTSNQVMIRMRLLLSWRTYDHLL
ncbi:hypothetical protein PR202_ga30255 [Eleusine coracana subsp. coracana]|uniref:Uncharacterized protein n=1 Tax=Eleusine coracana subsp. coracana TaxID=191504 RepID=A0AAV5DPF7_ELECO|nr:hypothetical protein PR202_ga30255 [Eleusine coracana subsp. coracana]